MEFFFTRLEKYIYVRPSVAMKDIIVKIMAEVLSILGIVTKEIKQGRTSTCFLIDFSLKIDLLAERYLKRLIGRKDVENALQRLDKLTQEEVRMAVVEALAIARGIDDTVKVVNDKVDGVDEKIQVVGYMVEGVDYGVKSLGHKVKGVDHVVKVIGHKMESVDHTTKGIDDKVGLVIKALTRLGVMETGLARQVSEQIEDRNCS
jgi:hypothetical protein